MLGIKWSFKKLTYLEYEIINEAYSGTVDIFDSGDSLTQDRRKFMSFVFAALSVVLLGVFINRVGNNLKYVQPSISETEKAVIQLTEAQPCQDIFLDAFSCESLYFFYKNRKPINSAVYMLPWYMDWYEKKDIEELLDKKPYVVVYDEKICWGIFCYDPSFAEELKKYYSRFGDTEQERIIWISNKD